MQIEKVLEKYIGSTFCFPEILIAYISTELNSIATTNLLKDLKGWISFKNYLSGIIVKSPNNYYIVYTNALGDSWVGISDDVVYDVKTWKVLVCEIIKEEQMPVALVWTSKPYNAKLGLELPATLKHSINSALTIPPSTIPTNKTMDIPSNKQSENDFPYWPCLKCHEMNEPTNKYCKKCFDIDYYKLDTKNPLDSDYKKSQRTFLLLT